MNLSSNASELQPHGSYIENVQPRLGNRPATEVNRSGMHSMAGQQHQKGVRDSDGIFMQKHRKASFLEGDSMYVDINEAQNQGRQVEDPSQGGMEPLGNNRKSKQVSALFNSELELNENDVQELANRGMEFSRD